MRIKKSGFKMCLRINVAAGQRKTLEQELGKESNEN